MEKTKELNPIPHIEKLTISQYDHGGARIFFDIESGRKLLVDTYYTEEFSRYILECVKKFFEATRSQNPTGIRDKNGNEILVPSFWYMTDFHGFVRLEGKNVKQIMKHAKEVAKKHTYGMVCPVIILDGEKELRRVGSPAHVDKHGKVDLTAWQESIMRDEVIQNFDAGKIKPQTL